MTERRPLQVLLTAEPDGSLVAGLPCAVRAAYRAARELAPERIVIAGADAEFISRWSFQLNSGGIPVRGGDEPSALDGTLPLLAVAGDAFPDEGALAALGPTLEAAPRGKRDIDGRPVAAFARDGAALGAGRDAPSAVLARALAAEAPAFAAGDFLDARTPGSGARAADVLYSRLAKDNDGYLARLDRRLSLALTRLMLPWPITPNQVTAAGLALGLLGAWWLAAPSAPRQFLGAALLWFCCLLDGCDGEIARLKLHMTTRGGDFDLWADHVAHIATFIALPIGVARLHPHTHWWLPGVLLFTGVAASAYSVWRLVLSVPESERGPLSVFVERIASRDYVYLILVFSAIGRLDWFIWTAAVGSHAFWLALWRLARRAPSASGAAARSAL
jgi:phosphatidylglycerophosphate synthase